MVKFIYYHTLVSPGIGADLQTFFFLRELITLLLPTLGYPMNPTEIVFLSLWKLSNYLNSFSKESLPKFLSTPALKAMVGFFWERCLTHLAVTEVGTRSVLFKM